MTTPRKPGLYDLWHAWPLFLARHYAAELWRDLPGPVPVKIALIVVCLAIPGGFDEIALVALTRVYRAWRLRKAATA
jgi:hypothetical protein